MVFLPLAGRSIASGLLKGCENESRENPILSDYLVIRYLPTKEAQWRIAANMEHVTRHVPRLLDIEALQLVVKTK